MTLINGNLVITPTAGDNQHLVNQLNGNLVGQINGMMGGSSYTIAQLLALSSPVQGQRAQITNGIASPTFHQAVSTTGAATQNVIYNNGAWVYG